MRLNTKTLTETHIQMGPIGVNATIPANSTGSYTVPYTLPSVIDKGSLFITGAYGPYVWSGWA